MLPAPAAADVARQRGLQRREEGWRKGKEEGLYVLSTPIHNVHNTDDWENMFCHTVTAENKASIPVLCTETVVQIVMAKALGYQGREL